MGKHVEMKPYFERFTPTLNAEKTLEPKRKSISTVLFESKYELTCLAVLLAVYLVLHSIGWL